MPQFKIRVNGVYMPRVKVRSTEDDRLELVVMDNELGWFVVDNNDDLADPALSKSVLEYRDEDLWALVSTEMKQASEDKGWQRVIPQELIEIFQVMGVIQ